MCNLVPAENNYVSVFQTARDVDEMYRNAQIFAASCFVPESFRGKPDDCLIALDLAFSLGVKPTSIFPHLYVVNRRPALSSQFIIALVNRSGQFSRIQWEEGVDGEVEYERYGKTVRVPNYYARAYFTERETGETLYSTRVDVALAKANGWLAKNESKWQTIPREMARWRSAAWLVKNYAPEAILGLEFADEVADATAEAPRGQARVAPKSREIVLDANQVVVHEIDDGDAIDVPSVDDFAERLNAAQTLAELQAVAEEISVAKLDGDDVARLRDAFLKRRAALPKTGKEEVKERLQEQVKETAKRTRKATKKAEPTEGKTDAEDESQEPNLDLTAAIMLRIKNVKTVDELNEIADEMKRETFSAEFYERDAQVVADAISARYMDFENGETQEATKPTPPTQIQKERGGRVRDGLYAAKNKAEVEHWRKTAREYLEKGFVTKEQADALDQIATEKEKALMV